MGRGVVARLRRHWTTLLFAAVILAAIAVLRTPASRISLAGFEEHLSAGGPVLVEFYSNY